MIVIESVIPQNATQLRFADHDEVVERFAPNRADEPLDVAILQCVSAAQQDDHGSPLPESDEYRLRRKLHRDRESDDLALRPRGKRQLPAQRSTRQSDW